MTPKLFFPIFSTLLFITTLAPSSHGNILSPSSSPHHHHDDIPHAGIAIPPSPLLSPGNTDCLAIVYDMADCLSFLAVGSAEENPTASCCLGFKSVMNADVECICEAVKDSKQLGIELNMTKAVGLPSACGMSLPPLHCDAISPASSPSYSPAQPRSTSQPPVALGADTPAEAPKSGSTTFSVPILSIFFMLSSSIVFRL